MAERLTWSDIDFSSGPLAGHSKFIWDDSNETQKAAYLELFREAIQYCSKNIGKQPKEVDLSQTGPYVVGFPKITLEVIAMYHRFYGDLQRSAELRHKFWADAEGSPILGYAEENPLYFVISGYEEAGMYKDALPFYEKKHQEDMEVIREFSDVELLKNNFSVYRERYPRLAEDYLSFMESWEQAKKLAKTSKPKLLDPAVQHHKWFYSDKTEEVLKALEYYRKHKVRFMVEKALKDKRPVIAKKAQEYLGNWDKPEAGVIVSTVPETGTK
jgi:hypothetical protein